MSANTKTHRNTIQGKDNQPPAAEIIQLDLLQRQKI